MIPVNAIPSAFPPYPPKFPDEIKVDETFALSDKTGRTIQTLRTGKYRKKKTDKQPVTPRRKGEDGELDLIV